MADEEHEHGRLPTPPIRNMTDFVVFSFVTIVVFILLSAIIGVMLAVVFSDRDVSQMIQILSDITTSLISALVGFLAGKGQGRAEVDQERREEAAQQSQPSPPPPQP